MIDFTVELAGVPVEIRCRFDSNREFLRDYISEKKPLLTLEPTGNDLMQMQKDFECMDEADGHPKHRRNDEFLENNVIHALLAEKLVAHNVLLIHGSALCMDGQAYIYTAKSGIGKSTHARLWRETFGDRVWMINDDKPMLRIEKNSVMVFGTPWDGKHHLSRNASAPLKAIIRLERGGKNLIVPMSRADAFPVLVKQCFRSKHPATMVRILELEKLLLSAVDFYTLTCNMSPEAALVANSGMHI